MRSIANSKEFALIAQTVEQMTENHRVGGSIPPKCTSQPDDAMVTCTTMASRNVGEFPSVKQGHPQNGPADGRLTRTSTCARGVISLGGSPSWSKAPHFDCGISDVRIVHPLPFTRAGLAQLAEHSPCKGEVVSSKPTAGTIFFLVPFV
jgi:hypothetical protein